MAATGTLSHIDVSVGDPSRSIPFYDTLLTGLGYRRDHYDLPGWQGPNPERATWSLPSAGAFAVEVRPASGDHRERRYDRYEPGPHHLAFHAADRSVVDRLHEAMCRIGAEVLDPPTDYGAEAAYSPGYYAVFFADPDGFKLEVAHIPRGGP